MSGKPFTIQCTKDGETHWHVTWDGFKACVGDRSFTARVTAPVPTPAAPSVSPVAASTTPATGTPGVTRRDARPTGKQLYKIKVSGGSWRDAFLGNRGEASVIIQALVNPETADSWKLPVSTDWDGDDWAVFPQELAYLRGELGPEWEDFDVETGKLKYYPHYEDPAPPSEPEREPEPESPAAREYYVGPPGLSTAERSARETVKAMLPLLDRVGDGYYAMDLGDGSHNDMKFFRLSRPTRGTDEGAVKLQWQIADNWRVAWLLRKNGSMWWPSAPFSVADYILALIADPTSAMRKYAQLIGMCCRCNTSLTDDRSRHYGIGPECEKHRPDIISMVDLEDAMNREEEAKRWH
jgi:hypothetical protein